MGENDAWQVAVADLMGAMIVGHDPKAFDRLGVRYDDHRAIERCAFLCFDKNFSYWPARFAP
jgi:hypothetical protein